MKKKITVAKLFNTIFFLAAAAAIIYFAIQKPATFGNILLAVIGFGIVIMIHEIGHFLIAKLCGITVQAFSVGFPPTLLAFQRTENGLRFSILPKLFTKQTDNEDQPQSALSFTVPKECTPSDTEYRIGIVPFGGFVKMLGQEDTGPVKESDNPGSFANKPIRIRIAVVVAGVTFNLIGALAILTAVFHVGISLPPAVIGSVMPGLAAEKAGLKAGDEIIEINGKTDLEFVDLMLAGAFSSENEKIPMKAKHPDGTVEDYQIVAGNVPGMTLRGFGIRATSSLKIAKVKDADDLYKQIGLQPDDEVFAVNYQEVSHGWQLDRAIENILEPQVTISAKRTDVDSDQTKIINTTLPLELTLAVNNNLNSDSDLTHIHSMVPRLKIGQVSGSKKSIVEKIAKNFSRKPTEPPLESSFLKAGDIITKIGDVKNPTFFELRQLTVEYEDKKMSVTVIRDIDGTEQELTIEVTPSTPPGGDRPLIGIGVGLDVEHPVVANTVDIDHGPKALEIPRGATITAVDGQPVENFYDVIRLLRKNRGQKISVDYRIDNDGGDISLNIPLHTDHITVKSQLASFVPFEDFKKIYKGRDIIESAAMGFRQMLGFVAQTYVTIKGLVIGNIGPENLIGPVGIATFSYEIIAAKNFVFYFYFLGMLSAILAVMNFLPIPITDGGVFIMLIIEKIKGSPVSQQTQQIVVYIGLALFATLFLYVTYQDILKLLL